jgi:hypothetical protein
MIKGKGYGDNKNFQKKCLASVNVYIFLTILLREESLNIDGQQFYQY